MKQLGPSGLGSGRGYLVRLGKLGVRGLTPFQEFFFALEFFGASFETSKVSLGPS